MWPKDKDVDTGWQAESAAVFRRDPLYKDPRVGLCAVCKTPVLIEHEPVAVTMSDGQPGVIHGNFDCMDRPRCEETHPVTDGSSWTTERCLLPANHTGDEYWGEPI